MPAISDIFIGLFLLSGSHTNYQRHLHWFIPSFGLSCQLSATFSLAYFLFQALTPAISDIFLLLFTRMLQELITKAFTILIVIFQNHFKFTLDFSFEVLYDYFQQVNCKK